ncbi:hypothetical protein [Kitasatospora sp. NPDC058046]|uniref:hypothetical protein n=1 Tax=Kitasatospora sp. NPDC058046 TaxID=3346312 RepID=UPI0036DA62F6
MTNSSSASSPRSEGLTAWALLALAGGLVSALYLYYAVVTSWYVARRYDGGNFFWWLLPVVLVAGNVAAAARVGSNAFASWGVRGLFAAGTAGVFFGYLHAHVADLANPVLQWVGPPSGALSGLFGLQILRLVAERRPWRPADRRP